MFGDILDPDLILIITIGLQSYFSDCNPDFLERLPDVTGAHRQYHDLIDQQSSIGWDQFIRGKVGKAWGSIQNKYAKRYDLVSESRHWQTKMVRLFANSSFRLWEIRNGCRHGIDAATLQIAKEEQAHREIRCLYMLRGQVLTQDRVLFRDTVELHLTETTAQLRAWITHNQKLIAHSAKLATIQTRLRIKRLQGFFPPYATVVSTIAHPSRATAPRRFRTTRLDPHFPVNHIRKSTSRRTTQKTKLRQYNTPDMSSYYAVTGTTQSRLTTIPEDTVHHTTSPQRRQIRRRHLIINDLFPDHPG
jgi:hypothetical protein